MLSDIEIAQQNKMEHITEIGEKLGIEPEYLELYGDYKAKVKFEKIRQIENNPLGKLILVTAITPTPAGEGKTTTTVGLGDALSLLGKKAMIALREPSLGPCFGIKGGAAGGGYSQVVPMEDINLHFTGDIHAVTSANNLLAAMVDNHLQQGNPLGLDPRRVSFRRCVDMNDRALRDIIIGLGGVLEGVPRESGFDISVASEVMAIFSLSKNIEDLKARLGEIIVGESYDKRFVRAKELKAAGSMSALLKDALKPNLVQTLEKTPAFVHGGPFANIAHGCNSVLATNTGLRLVDYLVTESGFGADLGAEKFFDIKCRKANLVPNAVVLVATIRALKMHGYADKKDLKTPNPKAVEKGLENLITHIENLKKFGVSTVVAINHFTSDTDDEIKLIQDASQSCGVRAIVTKGWAEGGRGVIPLAEEVISLCEDTPKFHCLYEDSLPLKEKVEKIVTEIYRAKTVVWQETALKKMERYTQDGYGNLPVCVAKTQNSITHDKNVVGAPKGYDVPVRDVKLSAGAGFMVAYAGDIMTMPGLPKVPAAEAIDVNSDGVISGLF